jgi:hypothetical protein
MAISSKKQFEQVSQAIAEARPRPNLAVYETSNPDWDKLVEILIETYSRDNPAFNAERFREACMYGEER